MNNLKLIGQFQQEEIKELSVTHKRMVVRTDTELKKASIFKN